MEAPGHVPSVPSPKSGTDVMCQICLSLFYLLTTQISSVKMKTLQCFKIL